MLNVRFLALALASSLSVASAQGATHAQSVVSYNTGTGFAAGFSNPSAALGEPSRITSGQFGGPVDPFSPPFLSEQLVSVGAGGSLAVSFGTPILNSPGNPFGVDFLIFGNSGFSITNGNFSGAGITDGSLFGNNNAGASRVSVSANGTTWYELALSLAPPVDGLFPTDGSGDFARAVNPNLAGTAFSGRDLAGIRSLYAGSGGGAGFDLSWARDGSGNAVNLPSVSYVRVDVLTGKVEIDGFAAVPEPATIWLGLAGAMALLYAGRKNK